MNYIELINRFWSIDLEANFSHLEVHLYFKLLEINNKLGWKESFKFPNSRLEAEIGSRPRNLINARQRLIDKGVIGYRKGSTRDAGLYSLLSDVGTKESNKTDYYQNEVTKDSNNGSNKDSNLCSNSEVISAPLNKLNKTKQEKEYSPKAPKLKPETIDYEKLVEMYHEQCSNLSRVTTLSDARKRAIKARVKEHGKERVAEMLKQAGKSKFLAGENPRNWKATLDWLFNPTNFVKVLDGNYDSSRTNGKPSKFKNESVTEYTKGL